MKARAKAEYSEADLAREVVGYLEAAGHDVYQEVAARRGGGGYIDIVSLVGLETWAIEAKLSFSLDLVAQCRDRRLVAQRVFAAVPAGRASRDACELCAELGIGVISVGMPWEHDPVARIHVAEMARKQSSDRRYARALRERCQPGHKNHAPAGTNGGGRYSPYTATCDALADFVRAHPGVGIKAAVEGIRHHYSSHAVARGTLPKWIEAGKVPGVRIVRVDRKVTLHPEAA